MPHHAQQYKHTQTRTNTPSTKTLRTIDQICTVFSVLMPLTAVPQILKLYTTQDASSLSIWMWVLYAITVLPFLAYGIAHKVRHLILLNLLWLVVQIIMIVGIVMY